MKIVLFCGGLGTRLREHSETIPKPLVTIGPRPIIWHLMKYYSHFGFNDFILCLGYQGNLIKDFFLNYDECLSNNFTFSNSGKDIELFNSDIDDWKITFVDTGLHSNIGQRLLSVKPFLQDDEWFMANYSDGLSDLPLPAYLDQCRQQDVIGNFVSVRTSQSFHSVHIGNNGLVETIGKIRETEFWLNGGFFVLKKEIFDHIQEGEELVEEPFKRLIEQKQLYSYQYSGFWGSMDTFKDKITFDRRYAAGDAPWEIWDRGRTGYPEKR